LALQFCLSQADLCPHFKTIWVLIFGIFNSPNYLCSVGFIRFPSPPTFSLTTKLKHDDQHDAKFMFAYVNADFMHLLKFHAQQCHKHYNSLSRFKSHINTLCPSLTVVRFLEYQTKLWKLSPSFSINNQKKK
jgi:hypothetical protein